MTQPNESAFARPSSSTSHQDGLTKREYFASMAMQGFLSEGEVSEIKTIAVLSVQMADALIEQLNKQSNL